jgi:hypothetical protein
MKLRLTISDGEKSRVPLGIDGFCILAGIKNGYKGNVFFEEAATRLNRELLYNIKNGNATAVFGEAILLYIPVKQCMPKVP